MKPNTKTSKNISGARRPIDVYFALYNERYPSAGDKLILSIFLLCFYFSVLGLVWIIPFPQLSWLSSFKGYFTWASFYVAGLGFYWYKQSPVLSYFLFVILFALSYGASQLAEMGALIGPPVWTICVPVLIASLTSLYVISRKRQTSFVKTLLQLPVWLVSFLGKKLGLRF